MTLEFPSTFAVETTIHQASWVALETPSVTLMDAYKYGCPPTLSMNLVEKYDRILAGDTPRVKMILK
jgi:hypothetical protein